MNIVLPGMNGYVLKENIKEMAPGIKALYYTILGIHPHLPYSGMGMNLQV
jgi:hypothetical protein